jgi:hypothetical protein
MSKSPFQLTHSIPQQMASYQSSPQTKETSSCNKDLDFDPIKETSADIDLQADKDTAPLEWVEQDGDKGSPKSKKAPKSKKVPKKGRACRRKASTHENESSLSNPLLTKPPGLKLALKMTTNLQTTSSIGTMMHQEPFLRHSLPTTWIAKYQKSSPLSS